MQIVVTAPGRHEGDGLRVGARYNVEPADEGSDAQNRAFRALCYEYWASGCFSCCASTPADLKKAIKYYHGAGLWWALDGDGCETLELKSWGDYTLRERMKTIDGLVKEMHMAGVDSAKFREILRGMEGGPRAGGEKLAMEALG